MMETSNLVRTYALLLAGILAGVAAGAVVGAAILPATGGQAFAAAPEPVFVKAQFEFASERLAAADALTLVGVAASEGSEPDLVALEWRKESSPFGFVSWRLHLVAGKGVLPDEPAPGVRVDRGGEQDAARLAIVNPQPGTVYEASLAYDPATGDLALALVDVQAGSLLYGLQAKAGAHFDRIHPAAGEGALAVWGSRAFLPVGVGWQIGERTPQGGLVPLVTLSKHEPVWLEVELPAQPLAGTYRLAGTKDGADVAWVDAFSGSGRVQIPLTLGDVRAGAWEVRLEYLDGAEAWALGTSRTVEVVEGVVSVGVSSVERREGKVLATLVAEGDGPVQDVPLQLFADIDRLQNGEWLPVARGRSVLETRTDVPGGAVEVPFVLDISDEDEQALMITFYSPNGVYDGVQVVSGRAQHFVPKWDTGTMGGIPQIDIAHDTHRQVIVEHVPGEYMGHPHTLLLEDGRTIFVVYPLGHGGPSVLKRSEDGGTTWSDRLPVDESWGRTANVPTIFQMVDPEGVARLFVYQNMSRPQRDPTERRATDEIAHSISLDGGRTWSPFQNTGLVGRVVPNTIIPISGGRYLTVFHLNSTVQMSVTSDGGLTWERQRTIARPAHPGARLTEPAVLKGPDGNELAVIIREDSRRYNSMLIVSRDEGETWSAPVELPATLTGDRHMPRFAPDGRLVVTFRDMAEGSPTQGDFVAWVGTWDDLVNQRPGQYRVRLLDSKGSARDTGYSGLELLPDGTFVSTSYVPLIQGGRPAVVSVRFTMEELDALVEQHNRTLNE